MDVVWEWGHDAVSAWVVWPTNAGSAWPASSDEVTQYCHDIVNNSSLQISVHYARYHYASFSCNT